MITLNQISEDSKKYFLLQFTKELIINSNPIEILETETVIKEKNLKQKVKETIKEKHKPPLQSTAQPIKSLEKKQFQIPRQKPFSSRTKQVLRIPEYRLPQRLQYLKPIPKSDVEIDLQKLNPLLKDPLVNSIECPGPDKNIIVRGGMGTKNTNIILTSEEIDSIIKKFSEISKIPIHEGIFKVAVGRLIFSAIISEIISSKFIIKKMTYNPQLKY